MKKTKYVVRRKCAMNTIVSRHHTLEGADRSLKRQMQGAIKQGGYSTDYIQNTETGDRVSLYEGRELAY